MLLRGLDKFLKEYSLYSPNTFQYNSIKFSIEYSLLILGKPELFFLSEYYKSELLYLYNKYKEINKI